MQKTAFIYFIFLFASSIACLHAQNKEALYPFPNAQGKWGYIDAQKNVKIAYQFSGASPFYEERAIVARAGKESDKPIFSVIDMQGNVLFDFNLVHNEPRELCQMTYYRYSDGLLHHTDYETDLPTHRYYDKAGKVILSLTKDVSIAHAFSEGLAYTQVTDSSWAYIDKTGKKVLEGKGSYSPMEVTFSHGWAVGKITKEDGRINMHYFNAKGEKNPFLQKYEGKIEELSEIHQGFAFVAVQNPDNTSLYPLLLILQPDGSFKNVEPHLYQSSPITYVTGYYFADGLAYIRYQPKHKKEHEEVHGYLNTAGKIAFELPAILRPAKPMGQEYVTAFGNHFHQGFACWRIETEKTFKIVYINTSGKVAFESPTFQK